MGIQHSIAWLFSTAAEARKPHPHDLPLLLQHLKSSQLLHVVLSCPIIQRLFCVFNQVAQAVALTKWPPVHVIDAAHPLQGSHTQTQSMLQQPTSHKSKS